ncbi:alkaline phosphatase D family protein, partial [Synechococcus sp. UW140]|uniref:alkaline phosphatase D family protein n=1 Tax=Synechococcus sp. UW140 TaxID=368503 RepID=UPI0031382DA3
LDVANNALHALPDLGFGSWEGATAVDTGNTNQVALILGDDYASATLGAPIYMYVGTKSTAANATFLQRNGLTGGRLYAWVATSGAALNRPSEFKGFGTSADGNWVEIATKDATKAGTTGYDAQGYKSADLLRKDADSKNAFLAARIEDLDYNPNNFKQVAFVATGNETFDGGVDLLGTVYTLDVTFNGAIPAASKLKIVYDGDDAGNGSAGLRSPDNIAFSKDGFIYAQEDKAVYSPASDSKYGTEKGSIWKLDPTTGKAIRWAQIDDSIDPDGAGGQALDTKDSGYLGYGWESSGIIDVSALYNHAPGTDFFANVQTHGVKGGAITDQNLVAGGQILKLESTSRKQIFSHGIASGDPYKDSVILWTRIDPTKIFAENAQVAWEISTTKTFSANTITRSGTFTTNKDRDWTVKVEAEGLTAGTQYYYRFKNGETYSEIGSTKTLAASAENIHLGVFSCANFTATNEFLTYGRAADINTSNPYDAYIHLGDYIYEYGKGGYSSAEEASSTRGFTPDKEITTLTDYRQRYAQYHSDSNLRELRASAPIIAIWDDHETANDSYDSGAQNHDSSEGTWAERRAAALTAYYEWMPIREPQLRDGTDQGTTSTSLAKGYRSFDFADVLSLHILETRLLARDKQLAYPTAADVQARIGQILTNPSETASYANKYKISAPTSQADAARFGAALAPAVTNELVAAIVNQAYNGNRELLGSEQLAWLKNEISTSTATWQVLGSGTLMQNMAIPAELLLNAGDPKVLAKYAAPLQKLALGQTLTAEEQALFNEAGKIPYNLDAWDGYGVEREEIFKAALQLGKSLVNLAGDTHNAWAGILDFMGNADIAQQAFPTGSFLVGTENRAAFKEIITSGENTNNKYRFNGIPDGIGVIDNGSTLRVLVTHELANTAGVARAHGSTGAYVSDLTIDKATLAVISGADFLKSANDLYLANSTGTGWTNGTTYAFSRFCSADLAAATAFKTSTAGYDGRIFLTGEESGAEGRAFAHIVTGAEAGRVYELPSLGNLSFENVVANPKEQAKTIAVGLDDTTVDGQVYVYIGSKAATGNAVEKAGLAGGKLFGVKVGAAAA